MPKRVPDPFEYDPHPVVHDDLYCKADFSIDLYSSVDKGFYSTSNVVIGKHTHVGPNCTIIGGVGQTVYIGDWCAISPNVTLITCGETPYGLIGPFYGDDVTDRDIGDIQIDSFCCVYTNGVVMPGVKMSVGSVLGANSFLKYHAACWGVYAGTPAEHQYDRNRAQMILYMKQCGIEKEIVEYASRF